MVLFKVWLNRLWFGIHNKILNFSYWNLCYNELFHDNRNNENQRILSMDLWCWNKIKVTLPNFAKYHCFWTLWTLNYVDFIPFSCIDYFQILFLNFQKTWLNLQLCGRGPIKSVRFICPSVCLSVCLWCIFFRNFSLDFSHFFTWVFFAIYTKNWQSNNLENCVCCLDDWVNERNLDPKWNIWHFNEGNITFCTLNDAP